MGSLRDVAWLGAAALAGFLIATGCSVGSGDGDVFGTVSAPDCDLEADSYDLNPNFFAASLIDDEQLEIRIQRGGDLERFSDGIVIVVFDTTMVREELLGMPIELGESAPVRMTLYMNDTCPLDRDDVPVTYDARKGAIVFRRIYAPDVSDDADIVGDFTGVVLEDLAEPMIRNAVLDGEFRFFYDRGRPAQRFP